ncbi:MAG: hypothetical protein O2857_12235 [Planctomycetota bacterium]|nr:hypothetical protein [Planctomycetota bacterium]
MNPRRAEELHSRKIDGPLSAEAEAELESLIKDAACQREVAGIIKAVALVEGMPRMKAPSELAGAIQQQIREQGSPKISKPNWSFGWIAAGIAALLALAFLASRGPAVSNNKPELAGHEQQNSSNGSKSTGSVQAKNPNAHPDVDPDNLATQLREPFQMEVHNSPNFEAQGKTTSRRFESGRLYIGPRNQFRVKAGESSSSKDDVSQSLPAPHLEILAKSDSVSGAKLQSILANAGATFTYSRSDDSFTFVAVISRNKVSEVVEQIERTESLELKNRRHIPNGKSRTPTTLVLRLNLK